jgi:hypothetical protein
MARSTRCVVHDVALPAMIGDWMTHGKHPWTSVHLPDMVSGTESKRGRRTTERRSSPARSTAPELNDGEGADPLGRGAALGSGEALGPAYGERGGVRWLNTDEVAENRGERGVDGLPEADTALMQTRCSEWPPFIVVHCIEATQAALGERKGGHGSVRWQSDHARAAQRRSGNGSRVKGT